MPELADHSILVQSFSPLSSGFAMLVATATTAFTNFNSVATDCTEEAC